MSQVKRLPYGISDFRQIMREDKYVVDKTMFIPKMEWQDNFLFLIRPRRFGKSIFLSMLKTYYDINERENFQENFRGLWIASHPTDLQGTFEVLHLDFSQIGGDIDNLHDRFDQYMCVMLDSYARQYAYLYPEGYYEGLQKYDSADAKLNYINEAARTYGHTRLLIVDEYDNFTNTVLNEQGEAIYHALTHASGFYRDVFKKFKGNYDRILMMGVSPVTMDDVTSGYNIATNISMNPVFNTMLGFSEEDVRQMIRYYKNVELLQREEDELIGEMKPWYDNYCFSAEVVDSDPKLFNCDMVCYYLSHVLQSGKSPNQMVDPNTKTDYSKMRKLIQMDRLDGYRQGILHEITEKGYIYAGLQESFPALDMMKERNFISLLFYYGMLTIGGTYGAEMKLIIPNNNVRRQYYDYLLEGYQSIATIDTGKLSRAYTQAAINGEWEPMIREITDIYSRTTSVRQLIEGERNLQGFMTAYLSLNPYYLTAPELELNHGYCDFFLMPDLNRYPIVAHSYILELKYLKTDATEAEADAQWQKAIEQIRKYTQAPVVRRLTGRTTLHPLVIQIRGSELLRMESL